MSCPIVRFYVGGKLLFEELVDGFTPRVKDEVGFDGKVFSVVRVVVHKQMCPPDRVHVHLELAEGEEIWPRWYF